MELLSDVTFNIQLTKITFCNYQLKIDEKIMTLTFPQVLQLRNKINLFTSAQGIEDIIQNENFVLLFIADKKHLVFLDIPKLLDLKEELAYCFSDF
ncbi:MULTISPECIES: hypothetical protein [unclassified Polaribacter]|uniref:hypothetical protein n=1 Tax=unclassified Polaribacter TaxID=196858 RepID=UPI0011BE9709|nr:MULTISPECIES: hypothetical protein [unclassified Polaribacter]TXD52433.1 hypothetical protein ES043_08550 [Polaribacter sp. IC063]TXD61070.1 hypothetical protein ES044_05820 [Polaribacter sp. IC066]